MDIALEPGDHRAQLAPRSTPVAVRWVRSVLALLARELLRFSVQKPMGSRTRSGDPTGTLCIFGFPPRFSGHIVILLSCSFSDHCPRNRGAEEIGRMSVSSFAHPASISGIATSRTLDPQQGTAPRVGGRQAGGSGCCHRWRGSPLAGRKAPSVHRRWQRCGVVR